MFFRSGHDEAFPKLLFNIKHRLLLNGYVDTIHLGVACLMMNELRAGGLLAAFKPADCLEGADSRAYLHTYPFHIYMHMPFNKDSSFPNELQQLLLARRT
jgi:hypothetical protein